MHFFIGNFLKKYCPCAIKFLIGNFWKKAFQKNLILVGWAFHDFLSGPETLKSGLILVFLGVECPDEIYHVGWNSAVGDPLDSGGSNLVAWPDGSWDCFRWKKKWASYKGASVTGSVMMRVPRALARTYTLHAFRGWVTQYCFSTQSLISEPEIAETPCSILSRRKGARAGTQNGQQFSDLPRFFLGDRLGHGSTRGYPHRPP